MNKIFSRLFFFTGLFAIIGGLYTWGEGSVFEQSELIKVLIPVADIMLTGPLSLIAAYAIHKQHSWGHVLGLVTSGIYVFGSLLVFISLSWTGDFSFHLVVPATAGFMIGTGFILWSLQEPSN